MSIRFQSEFLNSPIDIDELLSYNTDGFDSTHLTLSITARDDNGATTEKDEEIPLFYIGELDKQKNQFSWNFKNYSKLEIYMQIEIIDNNGDIITRGEKFKKSLSITDTLFTDNLPSVTYKNDEYFYRLRVWCVDEAWDSYFPNRDGILFKIDKDYKELREITINGDIRYMNKFLMDKLTNKNYIDPSYIKKLINLICNPVNNRVFKLTTGTKGKYLLTNKFDAYGEEANFGVNGEKYQFTMKDINHFISDRHKLNAYVDGKKIFHRDNNSQNKLDGISRSYLKEGDIKDDSTIELETFRNPLIDYEEIKCTYIIQTKEDVENLYTKGITVKTDGIGKYFSHRDFSVYVRFKNSNSWKRVNPKRTKIIVNYFTEDRFSLEVIIKDNYIPKIGNEIMVVSNNITESMFFKTDAFNLMANYYQVPCYFVPVSHVTSNGEVVTEFMEDIENVEVFVNGYRLTPNDDFALINMQLHNQIPSMILFKDMTHFGSKIELTFRDYMKNSYFFFSEVPKREDNRAIITLQDDSYPLIDGTFTIYANNKKLNSTQYDIINSKSLILKNIGTRKNIMITFHYQEDDLLKRLIELYKKYPSKDDIKSKRIGQDKFIEEWLKTHSSEAIEETDQDKYIGLKYIYQLKDKYQYFEQLFNMIKNNIAPELDSNNNNLFTGLKESPVVMDYMKKLPTYFNHDISVNCNRSYNERRFEDNISLFNPGRSYLINTKVDRQFIQDKDCDFDCNEIGSIEFLTYLNENLSLVLPYLNNNILIDCNEPYDKVNYKGLK